MSARAWWAAEPQVRSVPHESNFDREFEQFFLENYDAVVRALTVLTGDRERSTDATQEAFIKAYARWSKIRSYDMPAAWVRRIAINIGRDSHRSEHRRLRRERPHLQLDQPSPGDGIVGDSFARSLLASLPRRQCEVATLFYLDDRSVTEIAVILGLSEGTVKSHMSDARLNLRGLLERQGVDP